MLVDWMGNFAVTCHQSFLGATFERRATLTTSQPFAILHFSLLRIRTCSICGVSRFGRILPQGQCQLPLDPRRQEIQVEATTGSLLIVLVVVPTRLVRNC